jgi:O-antigen/teichoic acid export membrane protein
VSLLRKGAHVFTATWLALPAQFLTSVFVIRTLGATGRGEIVVLVSAAAVLVMLGHFGAPTAAIYYVRKGVFAERELLSSFLALILAETLILALVWLLGSAWFLDTFLAGTELSRWTVALAILSIPFQLANTFTSSLLLGLGESGAYSRAILGINLLTAALTLTLVVALPFGVPGALIAMIGANVAGSAYLISRIAARSVGQEWQVRRRPLVEMVRFGIRHYAGSVGAQLFKRGDNFVVAFFLGTGAVGYYSVATMAYDAVLTIPRAVANLLSGDAAGRDDAGAAEVVSQVTRNIIGLMIGAVLVLGTAAVWLVPLVYGADFVQAITPLHVLLAASVLVGGTIGLQAYFLSIGRPGLYGGFTLLAGAVNLLLSLWLVPRLGIVGNALATLIAAALSAALHLYFFNRFSRLPLRDVMLPKLAEVRLGVARIRAGVRLARSPNS